MNLCCILGSSRELSLAELSAVLSEKKYSFEVTGLGDTSVELNLSTFHDEQEFMDILGGCIKIGSLLGHVPRQSFCASTLANLIDNPSDRRLSFGISVSSVSEVSKNKRMDASQVKRLGIDVKRALKEKGVASRCVVSQDNSTTLSSVVVEKNKLLLPGGVELILIQHPEEFHIYTTKAVQPFEAFSMRDFGRPSRSMAIGMLPPKVARMMVNLSGVPQHHSTTLLDPFCGTGTILQEAALLGVRAVIGSDNSQASIASTNENLSWLRHHFPSITSTSFDIRLCDARKLHTLFEPAFFDAIVTETTLGPIVKKNTSIDPATIQKLEFLYLDSFRSFARILKSKARVVIAFPFWPSQRGDVFLPTIVGSLAAMGFNTITRDLLAPFNLPGSKRDSVLWYRDNQQVGREICVFTRT